MALITPEIAGRATAVHSRVDAGADGQQRAQPAIAADAPTGRRRPR
jgi:hypothetical protein